MVAPWPQSPGNDISLDQHVCFLAEGIEHTAIAVAYGENDNWNITIFRRMLSRVS